MMNQIITGSKTKNTTNPSTANTLGVAGSAVSGSGSGTDTTGVVGGAAISAGAGSIGGKGSGNSSKSAGNSTSSPTSANVISGARQPTPSKQKYGRVKQAVVLATGYGLHSAKRVNKRIEKYENKARKIDQKQREVEANIAATGNLSKQDKIDKLAEKRSRSLEKVSKAAEKHEEKKEIIKNIVENEKNIPVLNRFVYNPNKYSAEDAALLNLSSSSAELISQRAKSREELERRLRNIDRLTKNEKLTDEESGLIKKIRGGAYSEQLTQQERDTLEKLREKSDAGKKIASNVEKVMKANERMERLRADDAFIKEKTDNMLASLSLLPPNEKLTDQENKVIEKVKRISDLNLSKRGTDSITKEERDLLAGGLTKKEKATLENLKEKSDLGKNIALNAEMVIGANEIRNNIKANDTAINNLNNDINKLPQNEKLTDDESKLIKKIRGGAHAGDLTDDERNTLENLKGKSEFGKKIASDAEDVMHANEVLGSFKTETQDSFIKAKISELSGLKEGSDEYNDALKRIRNEVKQRITEQMETRKTPQYKRVSREIKSQRVNFEKEKSFEEDSRAKIEQLKEEEERRREEAERKKKGKGK